jgi:hypothetical protein
VAGDVGTYGTVVSAWVQWDVSLYTSYRPQHLLFELRVLVMRKRSEPNRFRWRMRYGWLFMDQGTNSCTKVVVGVFFKIS